MSSPGARVGGDCYLFHNSADYAAPTWVEIPEIGDLSFSELSMNLAEINVRSSKWTGNLPAQQRMAFEFTHLYGSDKTNWDLLKDAFFNRTVIEFAIMDGDVNVTGTYEGIRMQGLVEQFPWTQNLEEASMADTVRIALSYQDSAGTPREPEWYTVVTP